MIVQVRREHGEASQTSASSSDRAGWIENRPARGLRRLDLRELWQYRELGGFLALRDLKTRYKQAAFGAAWAVLQPLAGVAVLTIVFRRLAKVPSEGVPYPVFAFVGLSFWSYLSGSVVKATQSLVGNSALVTKVYFPRLLVPLAALLPGLVDLGLSLVVLAPLLLVYGVAPTWALLTLPVWLVVLVAVAFGVGVCLATLNVQYRDVNQLITLLVQLWFFISPVAYPSSLVPERWRLLYALNPVTAVLDGARWALLGSRPPPAASLAVSLCVTVLLGVGGVVYFQRTERRFADVI
jgi:homopolymeric O-antigen transport system permease protein